MASSWCASRRRSARWRGRARTTCGLRGAIMRGPRDGHVSSRWLATAAIALLGLLVPMATLVAAGPLTGDPFADAVVLFEPGTNAGFGQDGLPGIVLGPPRGGGLLKQSLDVVSLGNDGRIVVRFDDPVVCNGPGADFTVFENAFHAGSEDGPVFAEAGIVAVSQDGQTFFEFPYDAATLAGLAGLTPVLSNPDNGIDPTDPTVSGGDSFDLATVGLAWAAYVRITDPGASIDDPGNLVPPGTQGGFDLDAVAIVNPCVSPPSTVSPGSTSTTTTVTSSSTSTLVSATTTTTIGTSSTSTSTTVTSMTSTTLSGGAVCGNGTVDAGEECDDGNVVWQPGQSCAADCTAVACGDPDDSGTRSATDALLALRAAVGVATCDPCVCDVDGGVAGTAIAGGLATATEMRSAVTRAGITASDALRLLRFATGIAGIELACPPCE